MANDDLISEMAALEEAVRLLSLHMPPLSRELYQVRGAYLSSLLANMADGTALKRQEAQETCAAMVAFLAVALPRHHPLLGLQLYTLGDLLAMSLDNGNESIKYHVWARRVLMISHGKQHDLVQRLDS
jgi:hypothetical protein